MRPNPPSIYYLSPLIICRVSGAEPIPPDISVISWTSSSHTETNNHTHIYNLESPIHQTSTSLDCGQELEIPGTPPRHRKDTQPWPWGNGANHRTKQHNIFSNHLLIVELSSSIRAVFMLTWATLCDSNCGSSADHEHQWDGDHLLPVCSSLFDDSNQTQPALRGHIHIRDDVGWQWPQLSNQSPSSLWNFLFHVLGECEQEPGLRIMCELRFHIVFMDHRRTCDTTVTRSQRQSVEANHHAFTDVFLLPPPPPPPPLQVVPWARTQWPRWGTPLGLKRVSRGWCWKVERDSYTADPAGAARAVSGLHECCRRPAAQQGARAWCDRETWCLSTNRHRSMGGEPPTVLLPETQEQIRAGGEQTSTAPLTREAPQGKKNWDYRPPWFIWTVSRVSVTTVILKLRASFTSCILQ